MAIQGYNKNGVQGRISELKIKTRLHDGYSGLTPGDNVFTVSFKTSESKLCCNYCIAFCIALRCVALHCLVLSCLVLSCLVLSCLVLSCLVLSCLVLSCLVLSCLVFKEI